MNAIITAIRTILVFSFLLICISPIYPSMSYHWNQIELEDYTILYPDSMVNQAHQSVMSLTTFSPFLKKLTGYSGGDKVRLILEDKGLVTGGYYSPTEHRIQLYSSELGSQYSRLNTHEAIHFYQTNNVSGNGAILPEAFGYTLNPNWMMPRYLLEGIAIFGESSLSPYLGMLNTGYAHSVVSYLASKDTLPGPLTSHFPTFGYPSQQWYLLGGIFIEYLSQLYGENAITRFFNEQGQRFFALPGMLFPSLGIDASARRVFGQTIPELMSRWHKNEKLRARNLATPGRVVSETKSLINQRCLKRDETLLYYFETEEIQTGPLKSKKLSRICVLNLETGETTRLLNLPAEPGESLEIYESDLYFTVQEIEPGYENIENSGYGYTRILYRYNLKTKKLTLLKRGPIRDLTINDAGSLFYITRDQDYTRTHVWLFEVDESWKLETIPETLTEIEAYNGDLLVTKRTATGTEDIYRLNLASHTLEPLIITPHSEFGIRLSGTSLLFTAIYGGKQSAYEFDLITRRLYALTDQFFAREPIVFRGDLYYLSITETGMQIHKEHYRPKFTPMSVQQQLPPLLDDYITVKSKSLSLAENLMHLTKPGTRFFIVPLAGSDLLGLNRYGINVSSSTGAGINLNSRMFFPLEINLLLQPLTQSNSVATATYPLLKSLTQPIRSMDGTLMVDANGISAGLSLSSRMVHQSVSGSVFAGLNRSAVFTGAYEYALERGSLNAGLFLHYNRMLRPSINGLSLQYGTYSGFRVYMDFTHHLLNVRDGLWEPNIYIGDVFGRVFINGANYGSTILSIGAELEAEFGVLYFLRGTALVGLTQIKDNTSNFGYSRLYAGLKF